MPAAGSTQRMALPEDTSTPRSWRQDGLHVDAVLEHVARCTGNGANARSRLMAAIEACAELIAARQRLILTLDGQHRIWQLVQVADGRERARRLSSQEREALDSPLEEVRERAAQALAQWRGAGQKFASATHLLPAQLPHRLPQMPALTALEREALVQAHARLGWSTSTDGFAAALLRYSDAHQRCVDATRRVSGARAHRTSAEAAWRMGQRRLPWLANACLAELAAEESLLTAEASRAAARGAMSVLAGNKGWWVSHGSEDRVRVEA